MATRRTRRPTQNGEQAPRLRMKDVAAKAGVSSATVSRVLNGADYVQPEYKERVLQAITVTLQDSRDGRRRTTVPTDYAATDVSRKVVRIIHSYVDYVRRTVWSDLPDTPESRSRG